jgi:hypothetical protein
MKKKYLKKIILIIKNKILNLFEDFCNISLIIYKNFPELMPCIGIFIIFILYYILKK